MLGLHDGTHVEAEPVQGEKDFPFCVFVQGRRVFFVFVQREKIFCVFVSMCSNSHSSLGVAFMVLVLEYLRRRALVGK